jgi:hypothetical protein
MRLPASGFDCCHRLLRIGAVVAERNLRAPLGKGNRNGSADVAASAKDEG